MTRKTYADFVEHADYDFLWAVMRRSGIHSGEIRLFKRQGDDVTPPLGFLLHPATDAFCLKAGARGLNTRIIDKDGYTLREKDWLMDVTPADVLAWIGG